MTKPLTAEERDVMCNPEGAAERAFKSKRMLRILSNLNERGFLEFDPFAAKAELTDAGREALAGKTT